MSSRHIIAVEYQGMQEVTASNTENRLEKETSLLSSEHVRNDFVSNRIFALPES